MEYYSEAEAWSRDHIASVQRTRLQSTLEQAAKTSFYRHRMAEAGLDPATIKHADDIRKMPFTTKDDLRGAYPLGLVAVPQHELVRLHASSGTTGTPTVVCQTQDEINAWADLMARCMHMVGIRKDDIFQNMSIFNNINLIEYIDIRRMYRK